MAKGKGKGRKATKDKGRKEKSKAPKSADKGRPKSKNRSQQSVRTASPVRTENKRAATTASEQVVEEWGRRVEAEYRSAAITQHLTLWLIQLGVSPDLIHDGLRIVADEMAHAELSHHVFVAAGGTQIKPLVRESLALSQRPNESLEEVVARWGVEIFCLGETVAVPLFKVLREKCTAPSARTALDRVLRDEVRHRDFGWSLLEYLLQSPHEPAVRAVLDRELEGMFRRIRSSYAPEGGQKQTTIPQADRTWGLMAMARYAEILERTYTRDYKPRFAKLGVDSDPAWSASTGAASVAE